MKIGVVYLYDSIIILVDSPINHDDNDRIE